MINLTSPKTLVNGADVTVGASDLGIESSSFLSINLASVMACCVEYSHSDTRRANELSQISHLRGQCFKDWRYGEGSVGTVESSRLSTSKGGVERTTVLAKVTAAPERARSSPSPALGVPSSASSLGDRAEGQGLPGLVQSRFFVRARLRR
jgi:hypothetical protein